MSYASDSLLAATLAAEKARLAALAAIGSALIVAAAGSAR